MLYANTIGHDYAWDDSIVITENPYVKKGFKGIPDLFVKHHSDYKADKYGYRPVVLASFAIEYGLSKDNPGLGHFMNVFYFALLCVVIFNVLRRLFFKLTHLAPFLVCCLFIVHPLHVEVVANIKSRDEIFALLFSMLMLGQFIHYINARQMKHLLTCCLFFLLAFLSKEHTLVILPIFLLVVFMQEEQMNLKKNSLPLVIVFVLGCLGFIILKASSATSGVSASDGAGIYHESGILGNSFFYSDRFSEKLANAFLLLALYLKNFLWPIRQLYFYGYHQIPTASWGNALVYISLFIHLAVFVFAVLKFKKYTAICFGILFYLISISVYLHLFKVLADTMADRFMFTPSLGLCIILIFSLGQLLKWDWSKLTLSSFMDNHSKQINPAIKYGLLITLILLGIKTFSRNKVWKNSETLVKNDMPYLENCSRAHNYYADILKSQLGAGYTAELEAKMIQHYRKSFQISDKAYYAYLGLATYYCDSKKLKEGIALLDTVLRIYPDQADPNFYMGQALYSLQSYDKALPYLEKSLKLAPEVLSTYVIQSLTLAKLKQYDAAVQLIHTAKQKFGSSANLCEALGMIYFEKGDMDSSTKNTLEMINYGANAEIVYKVVIGRYQVKKMDAEAAFYYKQGIEKGIFSK